MKKIFLLIIGILLVVTLLYLLKTISLKNKERSVANGKIKVVASIYSLAEFAKKAGGNLIDVSYITPPGAEPHDYEPTPQDIVKIRSARIFLVNGNGIDAWAEKISVEAQKNGVEVLTMSKLLNISGQDPHFWLDPQLVKKEIGILRDILVKLDSVHAEDYQKNSSEYITKLNSLDAKYQLGLQNCKLNEIVVSHNAFSYLAKRYGFQTLYISGLSPDEEPSAKRISEITAIAKSKNIRYIFFERLVSPKIAQTIAKEIGATTLLLNPFEGLTKEEIGVQKNYLSVMEENLNNLRSALECL